MAAKGVRSFMAILSRFFGKPLASTPAVAEKPTVGPAGGSGFVHVPALDFYSQRASSPNGRYILAWRDGNDAGTEGGARASGKGRYVLFERGQPIVEGRMERPQDGKVGDNGTFVLNDWRFFTGELRGTFHAFNAGGSEILRCRYKANLFNNGLSCDGRYAVCQTCNSDDGRDSSVLTLFDLTHATEIARWRPESGWANTYDFSDDGQYVLLSNREGPPLRYTFSGEFVDRTLWVEAGLDRGDLFILGLVLKETHPKPQGDFARQLVASADKALGNIQPDDDRTRAWALKLKATCLDGLEDFSAALACYEQALLLDPKLGVKRRIEQLRKKLAASH